MKIPTLKKYTELLLMQIELMDGSYHFFLNAEFAGKNLLLVLDTGASRTVLDKDRLLAVVPDLPMEINPTVARGVGSEVENYVATLPQFRLGDLIINDMDIAVLDLSGVNDTYAKMGYPPIDGILGCDVLVNYGAVIDFRKKSLRLSL